MRQKTPKPVMERAMTKTWKLSVKPFSTEKNENVAMEMRKVFRRPMKSEMTPPKKPPAVMPMKYQSVHADVGHLQAPCVHERGGDEAEVPVVHLLAEVGHHDDEEDDFVEAGYGHSIKIVVGDLLDCRLAHSRFSKSRLCARVFDAVFRFLYPDYIAGKNTAFGNHRCFSLKRYEVEQLPVTMLREKEECLIQ